MQVSLRKRHRIGAGLLHFTQKTGIGSWIIGGNYWLLGRPVRVKHAYAVSTANIAASCSVRVRCATIRERLCNGTERTLTLKSGNVPRRPSGGMNRACA